MHTAHWQQLAKLDRRETARRAGCTYLADSASFAMSLLNEPYRIDMATNSTWQLVEGAEPTPAGFIEELCLLTYLLNATDIPLARELVHAEKLDPGGFFFRGSHKLPIEKLENAFGEAPAELKNVGRILDAQVCTFGDASIEVSVLPRIPITLIIWAGDEEFSARALILFDRSAAQQMPLDALYALAKLTISKVVKLCEARD
ncbi:MAG: DUF3786 domain-containing protein [Phycisphaerales bacterium]|nr:MAG: DUF3786 domain-containing protein [Phycisphaerales bacterium]